MHIDAINKGKNKFRSKSKNQHWEYIVHKLKANTNTSLFTSDWEYVVHKLKANTNTSLFSSDAN